VVPIWWVPEIPEPTCVARREQSMLESAVPCGGRRAASALGLSPRGTTGIGVDARQDLKWDGEEEFGRKYTAPPQLGTSGMALPLLAQRACFPTRARLAPRFIVACRGNESTRSSSIHGEREGGVEHSLVQRFWHPSVCSLWLRVG